MAIVGTGFIADFHARAIRNHPKAELVAVCDVNEQAAAAFAESHDAKAYNDFEAMLTSEQPHVVHVLTPPDSHHELAKSALLAGVHVFVEKPMCVSTAETADLLAVATERGLRIGVNHNMLFTSAYRRLLSEVEAGALGKLDYVNITHLSELGVLRAGPFSNWIARKPENALLEIGPHLLSELIALIGEPDRLHVTADREIAMPNGVTGYRRWRIHGDFGRTAADLIIDFGPGFPQRTLSARGMLGTALVDFNANTCIIDRRTPASLDFDRRTRTLSLAKQLRTQARSTIADTLLTKAKLRRSGNPDQSSINAMVDAFYAGIIDPRRNDTLTSGEFGHKVIGMCEQIIARADLVQPVSVTPSQQRTSAKPTVLVIGGTGFIGTALIAELTGRGYVVRAAARGDNPALRALAGDKLELVRGDFSRAGDIERMLEGIETVFHLATTDSKTWEQFVEREVEPARRLGEACLAHGIKRLIYTGTIDSLYAGSKAGRIVDETPLDPSIKRRNNYARAKAAAETVLLDLHRTRGLPVVVARPGIVIGSGGNPFHWGVGRWASEGVVELWGDGANKLPLVLVEDVAKGLAQAMVTPDIEGKAFNLVDAPLLSAREYIGALESFAGHKVDARPTSIWRYYLDDLMKWPVKIAVGHPDAQRRPSYGDWESRSQRAVFDNHSARSTLAWNPAGSAEQIIERGIGASLKSWLRARS
ncbi:NAD-dependent epimerase/dehydratase family protein [Sphingomonas sp. KRR8]|uniref:NAD-dependent epimerase/dehydratase family protein n=1 Tax=Sphingomonas sp. KRR8 TaxID=2942996 RepID=UPI0020201EEE|nr:NAD-dependent epimerase/dehydratase family protein [Sphingomonas sp. KRR8]URD61549.1 NAD-dependent epimerase/dehydratase family protein [Sphingomonas sp. KRR8]